MRISKAQRIQSFGNVTYRHTDCDVAALKMELVPIEEAFHRSIGGTSQLRMSLVGAGGLPSFSDSYPRQPAVAGPPPQLAPVAPAVAPPVFDAPAAGYGAYAAYGAAPADAGAPYWPYRVQQPSAARPAFDTEAPAPSATAAPDAGDRAPRREKRSGDAARGATYRSGKWLPEEEAYATRIAELFAAGSLPTAAADSTDGTTLTSLLALLLNCRPMRISKTQRIQSFGNVAYRHTACDVDSLRRDLVPLEEAFHRSIGGVANLRTSLLGTGGLDIPPFLTGAATAVRPAGSDRDSGAPRPDDGDAASDAPPLFRVYVAPPGYVGPDGGDAQPNFAMPPYVPLQGYHVPFPQPGACQQAPPPFPQAQQPFQGAPLPFLPAGAPLSFMPAGAPLPFPQTGAPGPFPYAQPYPPLASGAAPRYADADAAAFAHVQDGAHAATGGAGPTS